MKICAIIAEYNPLHNGHIRLIDFAKSQCDTIIAIMSGNFTQRAMPACADKYTRATHAVQNGIDAVIELPTIYATASAQNFALGGVQIANLLKADKLCFGSECGNINTLIDCAKTTLNMQNNEIIKDILKQGVSYPTAIARALPQFSEILQKPNNTLALEYIKALIVTNSKIQPITLSRQDNYNSDNIIEGYASASALRKMDIEQAKQYAPKNVIDDMLPDIEDNYKTFASTLLSTLDTEYFNNIEGVSEGLENKFVKAIPTNDYDKLIEQVKSKRYTQLKLQRIVMNAVLGITKDMVETCKSTLPYINVLAINKERTDILTHIDNCTTQSNQSLNIEKAKNFAEQITQKADKLYCALSNQTIKNYLRKI